MRRVRSMQGNLAFRVYASREDDRTVTVVPEWTDPSSFAAYLASDRRIPFNTSGIFRHYPELDSGPAKRGRKTA